MAEYLEESGVTRKQIGLRLLYTVLFLIVFEVLKLVIQVSALFQYVYLLIAKDYSKPLRAFSDRLGAYTHRVIRYVTLNDNQRPFPFSEFPAEDESPEEPVRFD